MKILREVPVEEYEAERLKYWQEYTEQRQEELDIDEHIDKGLPLEAIVKEAMKLNIPLNELYLEARDYYETMEYYLNWGAHPYDDIEIQIHVDEDVVEYKKRIASDARAKKKRDAKKLVDEKALYLTLKEKYEEEK